MAKAKRVKKYLALPKSIKIGGKRIRVKIYWGQLTIVGKAGHYRPTQFEIGVDMLDSNGQQVDDFYALHSFMHEVAHAIDDVYCDGGLFKGGDEDDHVMINQFVHGLIQFLQDNNFLNKDKLYKPVKEESCSKK